MNVRHAKLLNVYGRAARHGGLAIVPADVELDGESFQSSFGLSLLPSERPPAVLRRAIADGFDVAWVWATLPAAFGCTPTVSEVEKTFLLQGFVAVAEGTDRGVAFVCSDYYGRTALTFSDEEADEELKRRVAEAFWEILLADAETLVDFNGRFEHVGAGVVLECGCRDGEPYCEQVD